jgi:hypothetical protein
VSAKRRTVLALYCFDCVFNGSNNLLMVPYDELQVLPELAAKVDEFGMIMVVVVAKWGVYIGDNLSSHLSSAADPEPEDGESSFARLLRLPFALGSESLGCTG